MPRDPDQKLRRHPGYGCFFLFREIAAASSVKTALHSTIRHIHLLLKFMFYPCLLNPREQGILSAGNTQY